MILHAELCKTVSIAAFGKYAHLYGIIVQIYNVAIPINQLYHRSKF